MSQPTQQDMDAARAWINKYVAGYTDASLDEGFDPAEALHLSTAWLIQTISGIGGDE